MTKGSRTKHAKTKKRNSASFKSSAKPITQSQVRIIGGYFKRRQLPFYSIDGLRPTPDRLRETLFNWLAFELSDAHILDCCAGSGVLGFEALSRGAATCLFIETSKQQANLLKQNISLLNLKPKQVTVMTGAAEQVLCGLSTNSSSPLTYHMPFDVVFIDPPYDANLWQPILSALVDQSLIHDDSLLYIEADQPIAQILPDDFFANYHKQLVTLKQTHIGQIYAGLYGLCVKT